MKQIPWILIIILLGIIIFQRECRSPEVSEIQSIDIEWIYDSILVDTHVVEKPYPVREEIIEYDTIIEWKEIDIDTTAILADYYTKRYYDDTLVYNDDLYFRLEETIYRNEVYERNFEYKNFRPIEFELDSIPENKVKYFIGGEILGSPTHFGAGPSLGLLTKNDNLYTIKYDVVNKNFGVSIYFKFR